MRLRYLLMFSVALTMVIGGCERSTGPADVVEAPMAKPTDMGVVPGRYIVVFKDNVSADRVPAVASEMARAHAAAVHFVYANSIHGFAADMSQHEADMLLRDDRVDFIEPDRIMSVSQNGVTPDRGGNGNKHGGSGGSASQTTPWGITRVGGPGGATNSKIWVIDTGIDLDHPDLNVDRGRSANFVGRGKNTPDDGNGHGTHVSGTAAAKNNTINVVGVAPGASLVAVRVLDNNGLGYYSEVIAGVNYVAANASSDDVANMSLGGPASAALDNAVIALAAKGVKVAVAAGNDGVDCSSQSPARVNYPGVYTVSAIGTNDCLTSWSNFGATTVDYAAPGLSILSTWRGGGTATLSGTSMATPHVTGLLALSSLNSNGTACGDPDGVADPIAHK